MGSGSSKAKSQKPPPKRPVANVNKEEKIQPQEIKPSPALETLTNNDNQPSKKQDENDYIKQQNERNKSEKPNKKKKKSDPPTFQDRYDSGLVFEDDSDMDNDIDEVLKIPVAIEYPQSKKDKKDKKKTVDRGRDSQRDSNLNNNERDPSVGKRDENLPETYAQRLQRQQYKLQQNMLIREKTLYRNPNEWEADEKEEEDIQSRAFDASRFREANRRPDGKKQLFTTNDNSELMTPRYMQTGQNLDELQIQRRDESPNRQVPSYNQSELDLMAEIERDLL